MSCSIQATSSRVLECRLQYIMRAEQEGHRLEREAIKKWIEDGTVEQECIREYHGTQSV